jgi:FtsP/CotA-like multicopper oxidase with cupredoxin domain
MKRRQFVLSAAALAAGAAMPFPFHRTALAASQATRRLKVATRTHEVNGRAATVYGLTDASGHHGLTFGPGEAFRVDLENALSEHTIVHWHGLTPPVEQDGVADKPRPMLTPGEVRAYDFPIHAPGTYWMHAHTLQEQNLLAAPLIVRSEEDVKADMQEVVILLHDFSFTPAEELLAKLSGGMQHGAMDHGAMNHSDMDMGQMDMGQMDMGQMDMSQIDMGHMGGMDLNDIEYDAYLANDRTLDDPEVTTVEKGGRVRLRIINGAASTAFTISTGALSAELIAVDGKPVAPMKGSVFGMTMGQRIDLVVTIPREGGAFPILALREGAIQQTGIILTTAGAEIGKIATAAEKPGPVLDLSLEESLRATNPLVTRSADRRFMLHLTGDMATYRWGLMGADNLGAKPGERVEISLMNMSVMAHPMHLHGHEFQVVAIDERPFSGAMRDTLLVPPMRTITIAFDAGQPGDWAFHCHHLYHMMSGMMTFFRVA